MSMKKHINSINIKKYLIVCFLIFIGINHAIAQFEEQTGITLQGVGWSSAAWGDFNNDGYLDLLLAGETTDYGYISKIYKNNGNGTFSEQSSISLPGVPVLAWGDYNNDGYLDFFLGSEIYKNNGDETFSIQTGITFPYVSNGSVAWGDYNNDGYPDILLTGSSNGNIAKIYRNDGDGTFTEQTGIHIAGVINGSGTWGDYNNDGYLDILLTGFSDNGIISRIYRNNGNGTFTEQEGILSPKDLGSAAWGDYNNDGYMDILLTGDFGTFSNPAYFSKIYKNNGDGTFTEQTGSSLPGVYRSSGTWGDYNNDGYLDILFGSKIYQNNRDGTFTEQTGFSLPAVYTGIEAWGDYNNDGYLDILLTGKSGNGNISKIYKNIGAYEVNSIPSIPVNLQQIINFNNVTLKWDKATDAQTPQNGLSYNIRMGTTTGSSNIVSPMSSATDGSRWLPSMGNAGLATDFNLNLPVGTYYWSVQAIDNAYAGGLWATENTFTITAVQASDLAVDSIGFNEIKLSWTKGNGDRRIVFATEGNKTFIPPENNITYTASDTFGLGTQIETAGWYCVYNGTGNGVIISGLKLQDDTNYKIVVLEYTGSAGSEIYNINLETKNIILTKSELLFEEQTGITLQNVGIGSAAWGDFNNDGYLDLLLAGDPGNDGSKSKIYKNNGDGTFSELTTLPKGKGEWGDYNNDGYLDILIGSKIFKNNGNSTFTKLTDILFPNGCFSLNGGFWCSSEASGSWGDYDNDGYLDIYLPTEHGDKIYKNNGDETFSEQTGITLPSVSYTFKLGAWGDYDNDGYLDILIGTKVYKNNGDETFTEQSGISLPKGNGAWGDYNNDGYPDILIGSKIFKNNRDGTFTMQTGISLPFGTGAWGDYDNDGNLDIFIGSKIFKNLGTYRVNTKPSKPSNLQQTINLNSITLNWDKATDAQTPQNGLNYNIRIGSTPGGSNIVCPMASTISGYRRIPDIGNAGELNDGFIVENLLAGTYYWSVQAIDNAFAGGAWATENTFTITAIQASDLVVDSISFNEIKLSWTKGSGDKRIVFISEGNKVFAEPEKNNTYLAKTTFGSGTQIDSSGWYCVYNGTGNGVKVSGLIRDTSYKIVVLEYTGSTGSENYNINIKTKNIVSAKTKVLFEKQTGIIFSPHCDAIAIGDYNNDGFLDVLTTGYIGYSNDDSECKLYKNNGDGSFSELAGLLPTWELLGLGTLSAGDFNNDNYLDFILSGHNKFWWIATLIQKNNGNGTFTSLNFDESINKSIAWGDYNNDGYPDLLVGSEIYKNNAGETFSGQPGISLPNGTGTWADYNNDGYLDILIGSKIFKNNGDETFEEQTGISLPGGKAAWGDYNNDGFLDILITDYSDKGYISEIYKNNGDGTFIEQTGISLPLGMGAWGDYNNDGYLDILIGTKIYNNNGDGTFSEQTGISLSSDAKSWFDYNNDGQSDLQEGSILYLGYTLLSYSGIVYGLPPRVLAWFDYNNDGYLDIIIGNTVYKNNGAYAAVPKNTPPAAPINLKHIILGNNVSFNWDKATDAQTPQNGLSYNIRIGTTRGGSDIVCPSSSTGNGFRRIPVFGNAGQITHGYTIKNLPDGTYYWSVQAIDNAWAGGAWATENTFTVSMTDINDVSFNIYPNPAIDHIQINWDKSGPCQLDITDLSGKVILSKQIYQKEEQVDISGLKNGMYLIKIIINNKIKVKKLMILK
jgi:hypothetical protein